MSSTPVGETTTSSNWHRGHFLTCAKNLKENRRKMLLILVVTALIVAAVIVGIVLGIQSANDSSKSNSNDGIEDEAQSRTLIWSDEFDGSALNSDIWTIYVGNGCEEVTADGEAAPNCGFGNEELQSYEEANVYVEDGSLILEAKLEDVELPNGNLISSGKLVSTSTYSVQYGRVEAMITLPFGIGAWPSFFLLPVNETYGAWPASGEIDILETYNVKPAPDSTPILSSLHYGEEIYTGGSKGQNGCVMMDGHALGGEPHLFALEWSLESMKFFVDDYEFCVMTQWWTGGDLANRQAPFDQPFTITLALAIGGQVPQVYEIADIPDGTLPLQYKIDYVRVYAATDEEMAWTNPFPGDVVEKNAANLEYYGNEADSGPYRVDFETGLHAPFELTAASVRIDMELFDFGGEGIGYHDEDPTVNSGTNPLRPFDGVDLHEENIYIPPEGFKFGNSGGSYVKYMMDEWTAYTVSVLDDYDLLFVEIRHYTLATDSGFRIIADSTNCQDPESDGGILLVEVAAVAKSHLALQPAPADLELLDVSPCWQTQFWQAVPLSKGTHTLVFCSLADDISVSYMDFTPYVPVNPLTEGPGCS